MKRPVNLDLLNMKYPPMAIASILHRISGIVLFLLLPFMLYFLRLSLSSEASFTYLQNLLHAVSYKLLILCFWAAFIYHLLAGMRHMLMDLGFLEHLKSGRKSAITVIILAFIFTFGLGLWIW